ncbi:hypothetical protein J809_2122 [Acinetobacter sp. 25977_6]|nr:hypothetical protein J558_3176 [Acinetobacter baumannii 1106579]EXT39420.1 hypothetical protein J811_1231 [Acinetobacter sp. 25977_8]EXT43528.1 hypothetical protein J810_2229 [Acinetobacter sp. 25977_7]EXT44899.1 hypothetical protein J809_2122 [Acinetobacter sp. 25977_6]EXT46487.1 hypothetical protein J807_3665 [Acinetobacter sp. 25977_4]EXT57626.1 hypothetical protein J806_0674 [Acinetobacter sp. 25977_3]EXT60918.1 hypothetical protein J805_0695 [Acinetobacter sp. 25977_2]EXT63678.1 hypo
MPNYKPVIELMGFLRFWNNKNLISREVLCWGTSQFCRTDYGA